MLNSIGNQGVPQRPQGAPGQGVNQQARGDQRAGGLQRGNDQGQGFMRGHMRIRGGDGDGGSSQLTETERRMLALAHDASMRMLREQMESDGPVKVDRARFSSEAVDMLERESRQHGAPAGGGPADDRPAPGGAGGSGAVGDQRAPGGPGAVAPQDAPQPDQGPKGPTYTARRA